MHAEKMFNEVMEQYKGSSAEVEEKRELAAEILSKFEKVKQERQSLFQVFFNRTY